MMGDLPYNLYGVILIKIHEKECIELQRKVRRSRTSSYPVFIFVQKNCAFFFHYKLRARTSGFLKPLSYFTIPLIFSLSFLKVNSDFIFHWVLSFARKVESVHNVIGIRLLISFFSLLFFSLFVLF